MVLFFPYGLMVLAARVRMVKRKLMTGNESIIQSGRCSQMLLSVFAVQMCVGAAMKLVIRALMSGAYYLQNYVVLN